jgi:hypothetical protein
MEIQFNLEKVLSQQIVLFLTKQKQTLIERQIFSNGKNDTSYSVCHGFELNLNVAILAVGKIQFFCWWHYKLSKYVAYINKRQKYIKIISQNIFGSIKFVLKQLHFFIVIKLKHGYYELL